uniref:Amino acid permease n=2 Tax=Panagrellus redivivus TaxID=6233 RepID=A0A7E4W960_PANRE
MVIKPLQRVLSLMDGRQRRFSTLTQLNPETFKVIRTDERLRSITDDPELAQAPPVRRADRKQSVSQILHDKINNLALFRDDDEEAAKVPSGGAAVIAGYTVPGPSERASSERKKANLGVMLGVYLPTIQHILGVTMFIRLFWVVGIAGIWQTMILLLLCCACTLLTSISLSAVATNGVVESGGAYFMISRNLGAEFGSAVGILFYLANTVATSMYLVGGVEVLLLYIFPSMTIGGEEVHSDVGAFGMMTNNYRIYGTALLLLEVIIVALGVRFVQLLAPVSLACVILSIIACFAGGIEKAVANNGQHVCMLDDMLLPSKVYMNTSDLSQVCTFCEKSDEVRAFFCDVDDETLCKEFGAGTMECRKAFTGFSSETLNKNLNPLYLDKDEAFPGRKASKNEVSQDARVTFWILLAIYFPAVTGIMTGTNMSGDLADPQKSIPSGTIAATTTTSIIYFALALLFGASIEGAVLRDKSGKSLDSSLVVASLAWPTPWVVIIGSFLSTFGAALQCLCSAPRLLQSIAKDDVIPMLSPFARVTKSNEPFLGLLFTAFIAELAILLGAVDHIAEVLDFFFLMCYAFVNLICALHSLLGAPNWRPRYKYYHWSLSLAGGFLCFFIMFASNWVYALISCALTMIIYKYVEWKGAKKEWGDGIRGLALTTAQYSLLKVEDKDPHPKNWRPQLMILVDGKYSKETIDLRSVNLLNLAGQMKAGRGLAIAVGFVRSDNLHGLKKRGEEIKQRIAADMVAARLRGFGKCLFYEETQIRGAVSALYQSVGIGGLRPNTVILNFPKHGLDETALDQRIFGEQLVRGVQTENCVIVCKGITDFPKPSARLIGTMDIWWIVHDGGILMLIAYLLQQHKVWKGCKLRIFVIAEDDDNTPDLKAKLQKHIYMLRIDAMLFIVSTVNEADELDDDARIKTIQMEERSTRLRASFVRGAANGYVNQAFNISVDEPEKPITNNTLKAVKTAETSFTNDTESRKNSSDSTPPTPDDIFEDVKLDDVKFKKMTDAVRVNRVMLEYSANSQLVLLSLPKPPRSVTALIETYLVYVETLTEGLPRVLLIGGSGKEVITADS